MGMHSKATWHVFERDKKRGWQTVVAVANTLYSPLLLAVPCEELAVPPEEPYLIRAVPQTVSLEVTTCVAILVRKQPVHGLYVFSKTTKTTGNKRGHAGQRSHSGTRPLCVRFPLLYIALRYYSYHHYTTYMYK